MITDYSEASTAERQTALEALGITIEASKVSHEIKGSGVRFKWNVVVTYRGESEAFEYSNGDSLPASIKTVYDKEQFERFKLGAFQKKNTPTLVDVLWCLALDYESSNLSPFELMSEYSYTDPKEAEHVYHALQSNRLKLNRLHLPMDAIQKITEGY